MGMFDIVNLKCPHCAQIVEEQSKSGDPCMNSYDLKDAPMSVMEGVLGRVQCYHCSGIFMVEMVSKPKFKVRKLTKAEENGDEVDLSVM